MSKELQLRETTMPIGSLGSYRYFVNQAPMLTADEERDLAIRFHKYNDLEAAKKLVMSHLRFVVKIARGYSGYGLAQADLIQEGSIGLMKAVKRFDPTIGVRLVSFAVHWIKAEIHEFVLKNWRIVKIATTKAQRKLFFNLRKMSKRLGWQTKEEVEEVARELNVSTKDVLIMESRLNNIDTAFDSPTGDEDNFAPANYLEDNNADPALLLEHDNYQHNKEQQLKHSLTTLDARSLDILQSRWLSEKKSTLHDLAAKYNVSAERIRQLEQQAMKKLKHAIET